MTMHQAKAPEKGGQVKAARGERLTKAQMFNPKHSIIRKMHKPKVLKIKLKHPLPLSPKMLKFLKNTRILSPPSLFEYVKTK